MMSEYKVNRPESINKRKMINKVSSYMGTNAFGSTYGGKSNLNNNNFNSCDLDNILGFSSVRNNNISTAEEEKKS